MARLPQPGGDSGNWGEILNDYLEQSLTASGQLKENTVGSDQLVSNSVTADSLASDAVTTSAIADGSITETQLESTLQAKINSGVSAGSITNTEISPTAAIAQSKIANLEPDLASKATDSHVVHLGTTETITGSKNFTGGLAIGGSSVVATNDARLSDTRVPTNDTVSTNKIQDSAVTTPKINDAAVTAAKIANQTITNTQISPTAAIAQSKIANLETDLSAKANVTHTHVIGDVTNLQTSLNTISAAALPTGGSTGQVLKKLSGSNYDSSWADNLPTIPSSDSGTIAAGTWTLTDLSEKVIRATLGGNVTLALPTPGNTISFSISLVIKQDATGSRTLAFPAGTKSPYNILPTLSTAANSYDVIQLWWDGAQWWAFAGALGAL